MVERWTLAFLSSFHPFVDPAKHPTDQPSRPPLSFQLVRSPSPTTRSPWRPTRGGWTHRKTKTKNILSCFISFVDE